MNEWIPTSERLPDNTTTHVWVTFSDGSVAWRYWNVVSKNDLAWTPLVAPEPYMPPKPKRRRGNKDPWGHGMAYDWIEILSGDPDPDVMLEVLEEMRKWDSYTVKQWIKRIEESRSK